ncbi:unnamed protein product [Hymenolepis diminuta]|uniref:Uncharacterized protein n=1 Tax=Hymenolepis diminuta TaxID=6216 RepID=A0A564Y1N0_HYMDI|nr:unnamed protein product [Hymenolepis diminuta]
MYCQAFIKFSCLLEPVKLQGRYLAKVCILEFVTILGSSPVTKLASMHYLPSLMMLQCLLQKRSSVFQ